MEARQAALASAIGIEVLRQSAARALAAFL